MNRAAPAAAWDEDNRFRITSASEILSELRGVLAQRSWLTLHYGSERECMLSTVLDIDSAAQTLTLDASQDPLQHEKVLAAHALIVETEVHRIRIRFECARATPVTYQGQPALQLPLPVSLLRIQRRDAYRIDTPVNEAVHCRFVQATPPKHEIVLRIADLSVKGMAVTAELGHFPAQAGAVLKDCRIDLPQTGVVHCDAQIVRVFDMPRPGKPVLWIGCQFLRLAGGAGTLLQRYILDLERARIARSRRE
jgi:c-di-GMP-binding flagellar brake protein YcgR